MKICVISSNVIPCPPPGYAGLEMLTWQQAVGLHNRGHKVMLIAPKGSSVPEGIELFETELGQDEHASYDKYWPRLLDFDVILDSSWQKWSVMLRGEGRLKAPSLLWTHAPINTMFSSKPIDKPCFVTISKDQSTHLREHLGCDSRVCYNGVDVDHYKPTGQKRNNRYLFLARFSYIKGPDIAVDVAKKCNAALDLVGDDRLTGEPDLSQKMFAECALNPKLRYIGPQARSECVLWFNRNKAMLHANKHFREPFGLAPVEAQLCGMPVIAWKNGAMSETIKHGETGFVVSSQEEMEELVRIDAVSSIKPERCREWASQFSYENMINRCEELCIEAIQSGGW